MSTALSMVAAGLGLTICIPYAAEMVQQYGLVLRPVPVEIQHTRLSMIFHRRFEADGGHAWLRRLLLAVAREVGAARGGETAGPED